MILLCSWQVPKNPDNLETQVPEAEPEESSDGDDEGFECPTEFHEEAAEVHEHESEGEGMNEGGGEEGAEEERPREKDPVLCDEDLAEENEEDDEKGNEEGDSGSADDCVEEKVGKKSKTATGALKARGALTPLAIFYFTYIYILPELQSSKRTMIVNAIVFYIYICTCQF